MATWTTLDLLGTNDGEVESHVKDCYMEPGRLIGEQRHTGASSARELFVVQGETTGTSMSRSKVSKKVRRPISASSAKANQSADAGAAEDGVAAAVRAKEERHEVLSDSVSDIRALREQLEQSRRELAHTREEREELQMAFRRLDQEIANGYNLTERKEKEMKIAELLAKNQKISQMLEKELKNQETLRVANVDLQSQVQRLDQQTVLLNRVLASVETKHTALSEAHSQLTATHAAAQRLNADLQAQRETESASQRGVNYEEMLRGCEAKCSELQRKLDDNRALLRAEQDKNKALERTCEKLVEEKAALESEVAGVHDKMIRMNGAMKAMEASVEATSGGALGASILERVKERVRVLEEDVLVKNRLIGDLRETVNGLLSGEPVNQSRKGLKRRFPGAASTGARNDLASSRLATAIQRLRKAEESRDHKSRCLSVLLAMLPQLLQQLDALQDKFHAVAESNIILSNAVDQLQSSGQDGGELRSCGPPIALAREGYLLSGPYQPELLMGFTVSRALSEVSPAPPCKQTKFMPFHVRMRANITDSSSNQGELSLVADADDASGVAFLNRCKINAFLHFVQGNAAKSKCKQLLVQKIADLISTQRDLLHMHSTESGFYRASVAKLEAEVRQRAQQHAELQHQVERLQSAVGAASSGPMSRHMKLLLRLVHAVAEEPPSRRNTFLTQTEGCDSSDVLVSEGDDAASRSAYSRSEISLDLSDCDVGDADLEALLLKISVSPVRVHQLDLSDNWITDDGAATIAAFLGTCPCSLRILNLRGNTRISSEGVDRLQNGALKNPRACRVEVDLARNTLFVFSASQEYDSAGQPPILLQIHLPDQRPSGDHDQDKSVEEMIHRLDSLGFSGSGANWNRTEAAYRPKRTPSSVTQSSTGRPRHGSSKASSSISTRRTAFHDKKSCALESALRRADSSATARTSTGGAKRGISLSQMQYLLKSHASRSTTTPTKASATMSSQRLAKLHFAQSHLATIRGLGKR